MSTQRTSAWPENPFARPSALDFQYPPFDQIDAAHYRPAFERGMVEHAREVLAVAESSEPPTFDNTVAALESAGALLERVSKTFFNLASCHTSDELAVIQAEVAPQLSEHRDRLMMNQALFARVDAVYEARHAAQLTGVNLRLVERVHKDFVRAGARLPADSRASLQRINGQLSALTTRFQQALLTETNAAALHVSTREELAGLSEAQISAAETAARERGMEEGYLLTLSSFSNQPAQSLLENRDLRRRLHEASVSRGSSGGAHDTRDLVLEIVSLRAERAQLLGYDSHADYVLADRTAGSVAAVDELLQKLSTAAVANARREATELQTEADLAGAEHPIAAWDWSFFAEKVRQRRFALDAAEMRPFLDLERALQDGLFLVARRLYGLRFEERTDLPVYHPSVRVFAVYEQDGSERGLFVFDPWSRPSKRGGAWMSEYVTQAGLLEQLPVVAIHLNVTPPVAGEPALLSFTEVITLFHEFGHALHGLLSDVHWPRLSGLEVPWDFVEFPSQVNEMWATWPEVVRSYARHCESGAPMPQEMVERLIESQTFNQGYATTEYLAAAVLDLAWHRLSPSEVPSDVVAFERQAIQAAGLALDEVPPRYSSTYFAHIFAGGYAAGYYSYIWAEVLDADAVTWFKAGGGLKRELGQRLRDMVLSRGGSADAMELYRQFLGRDAEIEPLLERRALLPAA